MRPRLARASPSSPSAPKSWPATMMRPDVARSRPDSTARREDLPDPEGPRIATLSPSSSCRATPRKMSTGPAAPASVRVTSAASMTISGREDMENARVPTRSKFGSYGAFRRFVQTALLALLLTGAPAWAETKTVLAFGDSLMAGYGLKAGEGFAPQLERTLRGAGHDVRVIGAGVSGDTSAGGRQRIGWTLDNLPSKPDLVIVELGANDMLRGLDPKQTLRNLNAIIEEIRSRNMDVLIAGMLATPNIGQEKFEYFNRIYPFLARRHNVDLYPFFLRGVALRREYLLDDLLHPTPPACVLSRAASPPASSPRSTDACLSRPFPAALACRSAPPLEVAVMHRLFVGIDPPLMMKEALLEVMGGVIGARWQDEDQLHMTLRFLGERPMREANDIAEALAGVRARSVPLGIDGVGLFDRKGRPDQLWARVKPVEDARRLNRKVHARSRRSASRRKAAPISRTSRSPASRAAPARSRSSCANMAASPSRPL